MNINHWVVLAGSVFMSESSLRSSSPFVSKCSSSGAAGNIVERIVVHCGNNQDFQDWLEHLYRLIRGPASCSSLSKTSSSSCSAHSVSSPFVLSGDYWVSCPTLPAEDVREGVSMPLASGQFVFLGFELQSNLITSDFLLWREAHPHEHRVWRRAVQFCLTVLSYSG